MTIDSQKWSFYDETTTELEAKDVVNEQLTSTNGSKSLLSTAMYNRLLFGALVGFPTGAVFGASKSNLSWNTIETYLMFS